MRLTTTTMFATAALLAAAATGNAQSMKAEIPFKFQAAGANMQPGSYEVAVRYAGSGVPTFQIYNSDNRHSILVLPRSVDRPSRVAAKGSDPVLTFECTEGRCTLARVWDGSTSLYTFPTPKPGADTRIATVILRHDRGE
jgi:hypothetical protein